MSAPEVSVVVPTLNAGSLFEEVLGRLRAQEIDSGYEILVIDSGSTDGTAERARRHGAAVHEIAPGEFDHGATRDLGVSLSRGEYVALTVQDALPLHNRWLAAMVEDLRRDGRVAGVYGHQLPRPGCSPLTRVLTRSRPTASLERREQYAGGPEGYARLPPRERWSLATFDNVGSCLRRSVWERFPFGRSGFGEDLRWGKKVIEAGYKLVYEPRAAVLHSHERGTMYDLRRHYANQLVLLDLFGLELVPGLAALLPGTLRSAAYLYLRLLRDAEANESAPRLALPAIEHAAASQLGAYLAVKSRRLSRARPGLSGRMDRFLGRGV